MKVVVCLVVLCALAALCQAGPVNPTGKWVTTYEYRRSSNEERVFTYDAPFYICPGPDGVWYQSYGQVLGQLSGTSVLTQLEVDPENPDDVVVEGPYYETNFQSPDIAYPRVRSGFQKLRFYWETDQQPGKPATRSLSLEGFDYGFGARNSNGRSTTFTSVNVAVTEDELLTACMVPDSPAEFSPAGRFIGGNGLIGFTDDNDFCFFETLTVNFQGSSSGNGGFFFYGVPVAPGTENGDGSTTVGGQWYQRDPTDSSKQDNMWGDFTFRAIDDNTVVGWMTVGSAYLANEDNTYWTTFSRHPESDSQFDRECVRQSEQRWNIPSFRKNFRDLAEGNAITQILQ